MSDKEDNSWIVFSEPKDIEVGSETDSVNSDISVNSDDDKIIYHEHDEYVEFMQTCHKRISLGFLMGVCMMCGLCSLSFLPLLLQE